MKRQNVSQCHGYLLLEVLIAVVLLSVIAVSILPTINFMLTRSRRSTFDSQASLVLQAGMEGTYHIFMDNWQAYPHGRYKLISDISTSDKPRWILLPLAPDEEHLIQSKYKRVIEIQPITRDPQTGVQGPGNTDPDSRAVVTKVSWDEAGIAKNISAQLLLVKLGG